jgi:DNA-binding transcriptional ArsR family regulator
LHVLTEQPEDRPGPTQDELPGDPPKPDPPGFDPARDVELDPRSLRGLAHPLRLRLLAELKAHGPATATQLAERTGESSGATSYHLRQLAAYGFIAPAAVRRRGRERYWRAVYRSHWFEMSPTEAPDAEREVGGEYIRVVSRLYAERVQSFADSVETLAETLGPDWSHAWHMSDWLLDLTAEQASDLARQFHELCLPYRHDAGEPPPGTRSVVVQFQVLPTTDAGGPVAPSSADGRQAGARPSARPTGTADRASGQTGGGGGGGEAV